MKDREKEEKLFDAIADIDSQFIEESLSYEKDIRKRAKRYATGGIIAAAALILVCGGYFYSAGKTKPESNEILIKDVTKDSGGMIKGSPDEQNAETENDGETQGSDSIEDELTADKLTWSGKSRNLADEAGIEKVSDVQIVGNRNSVGTINVSEDFAYATADFSIELLKQCISSEKNVFISPLSVQIALSMTANGADGKTLEQMEKVLGGKQSITALNQNIRNYTDGLTCDDESHIKFADSIWINEDISADVSESFLAMAVRNYDADIYTAPFDMSTVNDVNCWVSENTDGKIKKMLDELSEDSGMCLINTVLFQANWSSPYKTTTDGEFTNYRGETKIVKVMQSVEDYYIEDQEATGFCKPYTEGYSFVALLPKKGVDIMDYASSLSGSHFIEMIEKAYRNYDVQVKCTLPKFTVEDSQDLIKPLENMGMKDAFSEYVADFSKMIDYDSGARIYIGKVLQKTYLSVDENGTEAAAATEVEMFKATGAEVKKTYEVNLDRPFIYAIIDNQKKLPIFIGTVLNPEG